MEAVALDSAQKIIDYSIIGALLILVVIALAVVVKWIVNTGVKQFETIQATHRAERAELLNVINTQATEYRVDAKNERAQLVSLIERTGTILHDVSLAFEGLKDKISACPKTHTTSSSQ